MGFLSNVLSKDDSCENACSSNGEVNRSNDDANNCVFFDFLLAFFFGIV
jgi:hypothetical protein